MAGDDWARTSGAEGVVVKATRLASTAALRARTPLAAMRSRRASFRIIVGDGTEQWSFPDPGHPIVDRAQHATRYGTPSKSDGLVLADTVSALHYLLYDCPSSKLACEKLAVMRSAVRELGPDTPTEAPGEVAVQAADCALRPPGTKGGPAIGALESRPPTVAFQELPEHVIEALKNRITAMTASLRGIDAALKRHVPHLGGGTAGRAWTLAEDVRAMLTMSGVPMNAADTRAQSSWGVFDTWVRRWCPRRGTEEQMADHAVQLNRQAVGAHGVSIDKQGNDTTVYRYQPLPLPERNDDG